VSVPSGTCAYGDVIRLDGVQIVGNGDASVLWSLNWQRAALFLYGNGAGVRSVKLTGVKAPGRQSPWEMTRITLFGASNFVIDNVTIEGSAAAGIQTAQSTNNGRITNNRISDTLADSIHITDKASYITVENNRIRNAGDDGVAVVSYRYDGGLVSHITARNNDIANNRWGRHMSVVGGSDVLYENNLLQNNQASFACVYIAQEGGYGTYAARNVTVQRNTLANCGGTSTGHGAVMVFSDGGEANTNITLARNDVQQTGQSGIRVFSPMNQNVTVDSNRVQGAAPALDISSPAVRIVPYTSGEVGYRAP
jgi:parallel beta-helix repeat protein